MGNVPDVVVQAINNMLAPYGESYSPEKSSGGGVSAGYKSWKGAAAYTSYSVSALRNFIKSGELEPPRKRGSGRNGRVAFSVEQLDRFMNRKGGKL